MWVSDAHECQKGALETPEVRVAGSCGPPWVLGIEHGSSGREARVSLALDLSLLRTMGRFPFIPALLNVVVKFDCHFEGLRIIKGT